MRDNHTTFLTQLLHDSWQPLVYLYLHRCRDPKGPSVAASTSWSLFSGLVRGPVSSRVSASLSAVLMFTRGRPLTWAASVLFPPPPHFHRPPSLSLSRAEAGKLCGLPTQVAESGQKHNGEAILYCTHLSSKIYVLEKFSKQ